ncbi:GMC family oxidoreductase [Psychromarinibacter halotolerans]|uniref:GMC family oxidoreductase n=1 Tax=Psychromarinibacter halotolerans TaxID=1775175 RepID=A0ABV7GZC5_9RHOB|nr:GMC family oxidoreductase N-terminal domain-containing protein [Psychromarinibacter halotolerans]MDF0596293.1 GMC family oxidoreductase N-terminal domain-containing protein [Psychromarinibacter halotolerans]
MTETAFDYVIVGAGSAGCVLANRLTADPDCRVLLIEAGGWDRDPLIHIPLGWGMMHKRRMHDWMYFGEPDPGLGGRSLEFARGKTIGGSSSINVMAYVRGNRADYDRWAGLGLPDLAYEKVLPYFKRSETWEGGETAFRGGSGPLRTRRTRFHDPLTDAWGEAGQAMGFPWVEDYNGASQSGLTRMQQFIYRGRRHSNARAYLYPVLGRKNLTVATGCLASRIVMQGTRATGIAYRQGDSEHVALADREVILSGGVINSPQLLMLSGIGDPAHLAEAGVRPVVDLPGVGQNLSDHVSVGIEFTRKEPGPFHHLMRADRISRAMAQAYLTGTGPATELPTGVTGFLPLDGGDGVPEVQLLFRASAAKPYMRAGLLRKPYADGFSARAVLLRPESRGHIKLKSNDPSTPVAIHQNLLSRDADMRDVIRGANLMREISRQPSMEQYLQAETAPGPGHEVTEDYVRRNAATAHHPVGTCKAGAATDDTAVVDPAFRVRGTEGLRVVDASVFPDLVGGNINAAVTMIAEFASDLVIAASASMRNEVA